MGIFGVELAANVEAEVAGRPLEHLEDRRFRDLPDQAVGLFGRDSRFFDERRFFAAGIDESTVGEK